MNIKVKIALAKTGLSQPLIAKEIGRSQTLVSMMFAGRHRGWEHRAAILALFRKHGCTLSERDAFPDVAAKKQRRAA